VKVGVDFSIRRILLRKSPGVIGVNVAKRRQLEPLGHGSNIFGVLVSKIAAA